MIKLLLKKALFLSAFFLSAVSVSQASDSCTSGLKKQRVEVRYVYDGDTLQLSDNRRVRLVGINTPELGKGPAWSRSIAKQAASTLKQWVSLHKQDVYLQIEKESHDSYGRTLGYIVDSTGLGPDVALLEKGLAYSVAVAPNLQKLRCHKAAEKRARLAGLGVWLHGPFSASSFDKKQLGFALVQGTVTRQYRFKTAEALVLDENVVVMLRRALPLSPISGRKVQVRGWVQAKKFKRGRFEASFVMYLSHTSNVEEL